MFDQSSHVNLIEVLWLAAGLVGFVFANISLYSAIRDEAAVDFIGVNGDMKAMAHSNIRTEIVRAIINACVIAIGIYAMTLAPSPYPYSPIGWIIVILLMVVPIGTAFNSANDVYVRHKLLKIHAQEKAERDATS